MQMWSRRNAFPLTDFCEVSCAPLVSTPSKPHSSDLNTIANGGEPEDPGFKFVTSLAYAVIPEVTREEAKMVLFWVFGNREVGSDCAAALGQIEFFFVGTNNGHLFVFPLLPPSMRPFVKKGTFARRKEEMFVPWNAGSLRLLHRHKLGESVMSVGTMGTLVASAGSDAYLHLSVYHPVPRHIVTIPHSSSIESMLMWEGDLFFTRETGLEQRSFIASAERSILYIFTGDETGVVRAWRVNVDDQSYFLLAVFASAAEAGYVGFASPLHYLASENTCHGGVPRKTSRAVHCLAIDDDQRLLGGVDGGVVVWSLAELPWKQREEDHIFCWDYKQLRMDYTASPRLRFRIARLPNMGVWVKGAGLLRESLCWEGREENVSSTSNDKRATVAHRSKWRPKYTARVANGLDLGAVCNLVGRSLSCNSSSFCSSEMNKNESAMSLLRGMCASLNFPSLRNTVQFPLWAVEPVFAPLHVIPTTGSACFALLVLRHGERVVTSGTDGKVTVLLWDKTASAYTMALVSGEGQGHCGLGRHLCLLRSPDIFVSCGYDDAVLKEWHVYDEPELLMRCERHFMLPPANAHHLALPSAQISVGEGPRVGGVSCAVSVPAFHALFLVGVFESTIQVFTLSEVQGCAPPDNYIYNGYKTVCVTEPTISNSRLDGETRFCGNCDVAGS